MHSQKSKPTFKTINRVKLNLKIVTLGSFVSSNIKTKALGGAVAVGGRQFTDQIVEAGNFHLDCD